MLFVDFYELTMAQLYYHMGLAEIPAVFEHFFRHYPDYGAHAAGYCINAGLESLLDWMRCVRFGRQETDALRSLRGRSGQPLFRDDFLKWLEGRGFESLVLRAIPEGRVVHAHVPLTVVEGSLAMAQMLESSLLNHLNYQILVATKACRIRQSGQGRPLVEFGLRRAHDLAGNAGTRAALIGGVDYSSNTGASLALGIKPAGTHGHSMVQAFMARGAGELDAFRAYADLYPDDCILLVDTINTLESGIPNAIKVFDELRRKGHAPAGIRLDSGDLACLSIRAAQMLDEAGFPDVQIVLSNQLDELVVSEIVRRIQGEASRFGVDADALVRRLIFGVGTNLITSQGCSALDGVYKLTAVQDKGAWRPAFKISEVMEKNLNPGRKGVWRIYDERGMAAADLLTLADEDPLESDRLVLRHPTDPNRQRVLEAPQRLRIELLLEEIPLGDSPARRPSDITGIRKRRDSDLERLDAGVRRIVGPHEYHVSLSQRLWDLKRELCHPEQSFNITKTSDSWRVKP